MVEIPQASRIHKHFCKNPSRRGVFFWSWSGFGGPPCTAGIVPNDNDVITFNVVTSVAIEEQTTKKELLHITDLLGRETKDINNEVLLYIYDDGTVEKRIILE